MSIPPETRKPRTITERLSDWYGCVTRLRRDRSLETMSDAEVNRLAQDAGISAAELRMLDRHGPRGAELLSKRMTILDLNPAEVASALPVSLHDLQRVCTLCSEKRKCLRDIELNPDDPHWKDYCPNAESLGDLNAMPWRSRDEWSC